LHKFQRRKPLERKIRFLLSRDDYYHQRGYWVIAKSLRNAGLEVVLGGIQTPDEIVETAIHESVDIIGYRIMNAAPFIVVSRLIEKMKEKGIENIPIVVGGIVSQNDEYRLREIGVSDIFHPYTPLNQIFSKIKSLGEGDN
jgi:methylmalonyl-CoA mutase C-terminal domain/subunit